MFVKNTTISSGGDRRRSVMERGGRQHSREIRKIRRAKDLPLGPKSET